VPGYNPPVTLAAGTRLGPYEILSPLGSGGMGEVYRARDTKLGRDVALKILPAVFSTDPERLARFTREAQVLASLDHPNIGAIHGFEESNGLQALVLELVDGPTLADRIATGPILLDEALPIARQIAEALEAAHEQGVTHRDLKPANIKLRSDGTVKVLDFGLAKLTEPLAASGTSAALLSQSPTITTPAMMTGVGMILGTAAYMSPEQAKGRPADKRSDVWAFGCVFYEILTGKRAFEGDDVSDTLAAVLKGEPDWDTLQGSTPVSIRKLIKRCLTKDRRQRLQAIGEARIALENPERDEPATAPATVPSAFRPSWLWPSASAVFFVVAAVLAVGRFRETLLPAQTVRASITLPESSTVHSFAVSSDGRSLVIAATVNGKRQLWLRAMDALQAQAMPFTEDASYPFWSPDSRSIGFFAQGKLKRIAASGGPAQAVCDVPAGRGGSWSREDIIVFASSAAGSPGAIQRVPAAGGVPSDVTKTAGVLRFPVFLPDSRHFLYLVTRGSSEKDGVFLSALDGKDNRRILADLSSVVFAPAASGNPIGHILFVRENTLMAQPFDAVSARAAGDAVPVAEGLSLTFTTANNFAPITVSDNGVLLYERRVAMAAPSGQVANGPNQIAWFDRGGKQQGPASAVGGVFAPAISPDEMTIAFTRQAADATNDIWLQDVARGTFRRFTSDASQNFDPFWSPHSDHIAFRSDRRGSSGDLYKKATSGSGEDELLLATPNPKVVNQWSPDGRFIVYTEIDPKTKADLWVLPVGQGKALSGESAGKAFLKTEFNEFQGQLSPDGHWMAYTSDETRQREVYVRPFPLSDGIWRISTAGGEQPRWRGDGKELFFVGADGQLTAVAVKGSVGIKPAFEVVGAPEPLFDAHLVTTETNVFEYDVSMNGKRFLVNTINAPPMSAPLVLLVNWQAALKK
jgi:serine/threonine protein kinase